jgi:hypothetical protein
MTTGIKLKSAASIQYPNSWTICGDRLMRFLELAYPVQFSLTIAMRSIVEHGQCGPAFSRLQSKKQRAGILDVSLGTTLCGRPQGNSSRMIWAADEDQSFRQAP